MRDCRVGILSRIVSGCVDKMRRGERGMEGGGADSQCRC